MLMSFHLVIILLIGSLTGLYVAHAQDGLLHRLPRDVLRKIAACHLSDSGDLVHFMMTSKQLHAEISDLVRMRSLLKNPRPDIEIPTRLREFVSLCDQDRSVSIPVSAQQAVGLYDVIRCQCGGRGPQLVEFVVLLITRIHPIVFGAAVHDLDDEDIRAVLAQLPRDLTLRLCDQLPLPAEIDEIVIKLMPRLMVPKVAAVVMSTELAKDLATRLPAPYDRLFPYHRSVVRAMDLIKAVSAQTGDVLGQIVLALLARGLRFHANDFNWKKFGSDSATLPVVYPLLRPDGAFEDWRVVQRCHEQGQYHHLRSLVGIPGLLQRMLGGPPHDENFKWIMRELLRHNDMKLIQFLMKFWVADTIGPRLLQIVEERGYLEKAELIRSMLPSSSCPPTPARITEP